MTEKTPVDDGFDKCFDALQRSSDNFRSGIYIFVLVFGGLLMWSLNAYLYPAEQNRIGHLKDGAVQAMQCIQQGTNVKSNVSREDVLTGQRSWLEATQAFPECRDYLANSLYFLSARPERNDKAAATGATKSSAEWEQTSPPLRGRMLGLPISAAASGPEDLRLKALDIDIDILKTQIENQHARAAGISQFNVPLLGLVSDRSWLWLISCTLGLFFYQVIVSQLSNMHRLLDYLATRINSEPRRLLLATNQVLTASNETAGGTGNIIAWVIMRTILAMPLIALGLLFIDWHYLLFTVEVGKDPGHAPALGTINASFLHDPEFIGGLVAMVVAIIEVTVLLRIYRLMNELGALHRKIEQPDRPASDLYLTSIAITLPPQQQGSVRRA